MQQLELFPELKSTEAYLGVSYRDEFGILYLSSQATNFFISQPNKSTCEGCAFLSAGAYNCNKTRHTVDCQKHPIIWVKKG